MAELLKKQQEIAAQIEAEKNKGQLRRCTK
jgi:hypothetical protein